MTTRNKTIIGISLLILVIIASAIAIKKQSPKGVITGEVVSLDLEQEVTLAQVVSKKIQKQEKFYEIDAAYPQFGIATMDKETADYVVRATQEFEQMVANDDFYTQEGRVSALIIEYTIKQSDRANVVVFTGYQDTGGAHPNPFVHTIAFNKQGELMTLNDLFAVPESEYLKRLQQISTKVLTEKLEGGFFKEGVEPKAENWANWYLLDNAVQILFSPYQVGPYAVGMPEVTIPFSQIQDLMK